MIKTSWSLSVVYLNHSLLTSSCCCSDLTMCSVRIMIKRWNSDYKSNGFKINFKLTTQSNWGSACFSLDQIRSVIAWSFIFPKLLFKLHNDYIFIDLIKIRYLSKFWKQSFWILYQNLAKAFKLLHGYSVTRLLSRITLVKQYYIALRINTVLRIEPLYRYSTLCF